MDFFNSFKNEIISYKPAGFEALAIKLFKFQAENNPVYQKYLSCLNVNPEQISRVEEIPFLPIDFFKSQTIKTGTWQESAIFESSGSTGPNTSRHYIHDLDFYLEVAEQIFQKFYGQFENYHIFALLPSYLERENSSLIYMVKRFIEKSGSPLSGFYLYDHEKLVDQLKKTSDNRSVILFGATFALLDLAEKYALDLPDLIIMETGGMKGRRKEIVREEVHQKLKTAFGTAAIHSEYGMTELLSQAYARREGQFETPPWMKILIREINDPFRIDNSLRQGGINIIDLANVHSCAFIETRDLGFVNETEGYFCVTGRMDNSDIRGCSLLVA